FILNYTLHKRFNFTLGTDLTHDAMVESLGQDPNTGKAWITRENLGKYLTSYLNVNAPFQINRSWSMNNNLSAVYMHFKGSIAGSYIDDGSPLFQGKSINSFKLSNTVAAEMSINYASTFIYNV